MKAAVPITVGSRGIYTHFIFIQFVSKLLFEEEIWRFQTFFFSLKVLKSFKLYKDPYLRA